MLRANWLLICIASMAFGLSCQSASTTNYTSTSPGAGAATENSRNFSIDAGGATYQVSLFSKTYGALAGPAFSLVLVSPVLVSDEVLYNSGSSSIIPWFNSRGVAVWLVRIPPQSAIEKFGRDILPQVTSAIRKNSNDSDWVMGGISLGGQAIIHYLQNAPQHATVTGMQVKAAFFLGTPFDYDYAGSFGRRLAKENLAPADFARRFAPGLKASLISPRQNLFAAGKPVWSDSLQNISVKDKGVRIFFLAGKIDNVAPSESVYKYFVKTIGDETKNSPDVRFMQPGRMNRHALDFDHGMMVASDELADDILPEILRWLDL